MTVNRETIKAKVVNLLKVYEKFEQGGRDLAHTDSNSRSDY